MPLAANRLDAHQYSRNFSELKPALTPGETRAETGRCLYCWDAPCTRACPTGIDVPRFIRQIRTANLKGAARTILEANPLGGSCARVCPVEILCEGACVLNASEHRPVAIGRLQRTATDAALAGNWTLHQQLPDTGRSVAIVGAGPAGLACARVLAQAGVAVELHDRADHAGGLMSDGVAAYKVTEAFVRAEIDWLLDHRLIRLRRGSELGRNLSLEELQQRHDALFLAFGVGITEPLGIGGEHGQGVVDALDFIHRLRRNPLHTVPVGARVAVIGLGMTAIDAATQAARLGAEEVHLVYRRSPAEKPCTEAELALAVADGCRIHWLSAPSEVLLDGGQVCGLRCQRMSLEPDPEGGRARPVPTGEHFELGVDMVIRAIGQKPYGALVQALGLDARQGRLEVDGQGRTSVPAVYAGGDCVNGGREVVDAVEAGKRAAAAILADLGCVTPPAERS